MCFARQQAIAWFTHVAGERATESVLYTGRIACATATMMESGKDHLIIAE